MRFEVEVFGPSPREWEVLVSRDHRMLRVRAGAVCGGDAERAWPDRV